MKNPFDNFDNDGFFDSDPSDDLTDHFDDALQSPEHHDDSLFGNDGLGDSELHGNLHDSGMQDTNLSDWNDSHSGFHDNLNDSGILDASHSVWNDSHSGFHDNLNDSGILDASHSVWDDSHLGLHDNLHDSGMSDMNHSDWDDAATSSQFDNSGDLGHSDFQNHGHDPLGSDPHHTDWTDAAPDMSHSDDHHSEEQSDSGDMSENHMPDFDHLNQMLHGGHHSFHSMQAHSVRFACSDSSNKHPYTTIDSSGYVYLNGEKEIGRIDGHTIYNKSYDNCGYWTTDGKVYDYYDHFVGWVHPDGHVYAKGSNGDLEVYKTTGGAAGGAAYLLLVWCGGQTHL